MKRKEEKHDLLIKKGYFRKTFKKAISIIILAAFICGAGQPLMIKEVKAATTSRKYGDVNWDGTVNNSDFLWVTQHISASTINDIKSKHPDWILTGDDFKAADVNTDGVIDSRDSTRINEHASASAVDSIRAKHPDWILKKTFSSSYPDDGYYTIVSAMNTSKAIDASGCNASNGTNIQLYDKNGTRAQVFYLKRKGRFYTINLIASNAMMDVAGGVTTKGTNVQLYENNGSDAQLWKFDSAGSGNYYIRSKLGHFLDVAKANQANGTNIGVWIQKNANNQKFKLLNIGNGTAMYTQASVVLRKSASEKATAIQTLSKGSQVYRYCTFGNWSMVKANGKCGYIPTKDLGKNKPVENTKRNNIVNYMKSMATIEWTPKTSFTYYKDGRKYWEKGKIYKGIPYSQAYRNTSLEKFRANLNGKVYVGPTKPDSYLGNDCSSAVSMAWKKANSKFQITSTVGFLPGNKNIKKVGSYDYKSSSITKTTCSYNKVNKMVKAYKKLKPGDAVVTRYKEGKKIVGHVMLVSSVQSNSIKVIEQTTLEGNSTWRVNKEYTFSVLFKNDYIPVKMSGLD